MPPTPSPPESGLIRLRLPAGLAWRPRQTGAFILGALFGVLSSPCATPVLAALLGLVQTFAQAHRLTRFAQWLNRGLGVLLLAAGGWLIMQARSGMEEAASFPPLVRLPRKSPMSRKTSRGFKTRGRLQRDCTTIPHFTVESAAP